MKNQSTANNYDSAIDVSLNEEGEFIETFDTSLPPADAKRTEARRLIEERNEAKRLKNELRELDWFHSDDDLQ